MEPTTVAGEVPSFEDARNMAEMRGRWSSSALPDTSDLNKRGTMGGSHEKMESKTSHHGEFKSKVPFTVNSEKKLDSWGRRTHSFLLYDPPKPTLIGLAISLCAIVLFSTSTFISALSKIGWMALVASLAIVNTYVGVTYLISQKASPQVLARKAYERYHISPQTIARITENVDEFITVVLEEGSKILLVENRWRSLKWACGLYATSWLCAKISGTTALTLATLTLFTVPKFYSTFEKPIKRNLKQAQDKLDAGYTRVQHDLNQYADATTEKLRDIRNHSDVYVQKAVDNVKGVAAKTVEISKDAASKTMEVSKNAASKTMDASKNAASKTVEVSKDAAAKTSELSSAAAARASDTAKSAAETVKSAAQNAQMYATQTVESVKSSAAQAVDTAKNVVYKTEKSAAEATDSAKKAAQMGIHETKVGADATKAYVEGIKEGVVEGHHLGKQNARREAEAMKEE